MKQFLILLALVAPTVWADKSHALYSYNAQAYIQNQNTDSIRSIASITKLFTAITVLNAEQDLNESVEVNCKNRGRIANGMHVTRQDLLTAMVVSSDNCAAETLANTYPGGYDRFIFDRNQFLIDSGLKNTKLHDSTGLSVFNVSTVDDLVVFAPIAYQNTVLRDISNLPEATVSAYRKGQKISFKLRNTNPAVSNHPEVMVSKTGFTSAAGRCVLMLVQKVTDVYAVVILGEPNVQSRSRRMEKMLAYNEPKRR